MSIQRVPADAADLFPVRLKTVIPTSPFYAQRQQQNVAKLKADARNGVGRSSGCRKQRG
jgi:hypothetical protein